MRNLILAVLVAVFLPACATSQYPGKANHVTPKLRNPYLASISLLNEDLRVFCSGTIIRNEEGEPLQILTAAHCTDQDFIFVTTKYDSEIRPASVTKADYRVDLAILTTLLNEKSDGPYVKISRSNPKLGDEVTAIGNPSGNEGIVTSGNISKWQESDGVLYYRYTNPTYFGSSGGGVFNKHGKLVGVVDLLEYAFSQLIVIDEATGMPFEVNAWCPSVKPGGFLAVSLPEIHKFLKK